VIRAAAFCGVVVALAGCGTPANPPEAVRTPATAQETAHPTRPCEGPCTTTRTSTRPGGASATATAAPDSPASEWSASAPTATSKPADSTTPVKVPSYSRDQFGSGWVDPDGNGCDARQDAVRRAVVKVITRTGACQIRVGDIRDVYSGRTYPAATTSSFDVDHVVSLHDAWVSGAYKWTRAKRVAYANDPSVLVLTTASANRSKSDQGPDTWSPVSHDGACWYVRAYRNIKRVWALRTTGPQRAAIRRTLATCNGTEGR
jgi:hypothetical protein